jgi:hypothetical protein
MLHVTHTTKRIKSWVTAGSPESRIHIFTHAAILPQDLESRIYPLILLTEHITVIDQ